MGNLQPPVFLLAMPQVLDPFFHKSVVLLIAHEDEGSFGFIVNRPTGIRVADILNGLEIGWHGDASTLAHFGGPVQPNLGTVVYGREGASRGDDGPDVLPGVGITQQASALAVLGAEPPAAFRLFLGYAGWGAGQLIEEILRNDWLTAPVSTPLLFSAEPETIWQEALRSVGVDPATLPSWTPSGGDSAAN